jgi:hypothetical protein
MRDSGSVDDRYRSLLQKAVRRGHPELVYTISALIEHQGVHSPSWFEKRAAVIVLGECWPLGREMAFTRGIHSKVAALVRVAGVRKARDATGLGFMAYAFAQGDATVLNRTSEDRSIKLVAKAVRHPSDFWEWIDAQPADEHARALVANARRFREGGRPHDKAVTQAAAYLAVSTPPPDTGAAAKADPAFPFWVVFDRHTSDGRRVLRDVARDLHIPLPQMEWCFFYFEGAAANADAPSPWWQRYCRWHFERIGLRPEEAHLIWEPARAQLSAALAEESLRLQADLYRWKLENMERVETLKRQVELFNSRMHPVSGDPPTLF